jgi:Ca2+-binding RTX toxin-like protein
MVDIVVANWGSDNVSVLTGNADGTFQSAANYAVGDGPFSVSVGDVTGDGVLDVVTALFGEPLNLDSGDISVLPGNGDGTFQSSIKYDVGDRPRSVSVVDVNGDGNADVVAATGSSDNVAVLLGNGEGALQAVWAFCDPESVSVGDVSGDGVPDIVTANRNSDDVSVLLGDGGGTFQTTVNYHVGDGPRDVLLVDLNKDSVFDIVTVNELSDNASVLLGHGDGSFQSALNVTVGDSPFSVSSGDLNGDGKLDIVTANRDSNNVSVLTGNGDGTFATAVNYGAESGTTSVSVGDVTEDGTLDIVAANQFSDSVSIFVGNGDGTFQAAQNYPAGDWPLSVSVEDTDGDGTLDIVTANRTTDTVSVLRGVGDGTFPTVVQYPVGDFPSSLFLFDVSDDGVLDLVTANFNSDDVSVLVGKSDGTFQSSISYTMGNAPASVSVGDVTGDGVADIVTANQYSDNLSILVGTGARLLTLPTLDGGLDVLPLRGTPIVFGEAFGETWWIARTGQVTEYVLWSHGESKGLRQRAQLSAGFTDQRSITLRASGSSLAMFSNDEFYEYDPETNEVTATRGADGTFQAATEKSVGDDPRSMSLTDVDADGVLDIVTANLASDNVSVLTGNADGTFETAVNFSTGDGPFSVAVGDVTGDGVLDIVAANIFGDDVSVLLGDGDGGFQDTVNYSVGAGCSGWDGYYCRPLSVALSDVNSDGQMDIITANQNSDNVTVLLGNGNGTFQSGISYPAGDDPFAMSLGDVNADDIVDIVTANLYSNDMSVLLGNADGTFNAAMNYAVGDAPLSVSLGDVDRDGATDIVTVTFHNENVSVLLGNGDGTFDAPINFEAGGAPRVGSSLLDVTGDGLLDIAIANLNSGNVSVLVGNGDGTFHNPVNYAVGDAPLSVSFGDVTGDGILDIVTANAASDNISVLAGQSSVINVLDLAGTTVFGNRTAVRVRQSGGMTFQPLTIHAVASVLGNLENPRDYEFVHLGVFNDKLLASVRLKDTTARPGELQVLLIDAPQFDEQGNVLPSIAENLSFNTSLRLTVSDDDALFVTDDQIILTAEVVGSGIGSELFSLDRQNGLRLVADVLPGTESSQSRDFVADGNNVYFTALASRVDNDTRQSGFRRELFVVNLIENTVREIRAGREAGGRLSLVGDSLFFSDRLTSESLPQLFSYDTGQNGVDPHGASIPTTGDVTGTVFLDRNSDGQRNIGEPGRSGVTLYVDANGNGQREAIEPFVISRLDDPATQEDEIGQFEFLGLAAGTHELREVPADGFRQTAPLTILADTDPVLTELATVTTSGDDPDLGLPSIVGGDVVYVNLADSKLVVRESDSDTDVPLVTLGSVIPDEDLSIASIGGSHAQDGNSIVLTATLTDDRELVLVVDSSGRLELVAETGSPLTTVPPGGQPASTTLTDIEDARNQGFDSLSIVESSVGFLAETADGRQGYFLGGATQARFAEFDHAQVLLDGNNESFVDRVVEETGTVLTGSDLFLDKASLDAREGANTGWQITTRSGIEILPLTFFDRIFDVSISGLSAAFKASDVAGNEALYLSSADGDLTREVDTSTSIPAGSGQFTRFGSNRDTPVNPSVALDGENYLFVGARDHATGSPPISMAIGDVNGDEFSDIVTTHSEHISVLIGNGDGTFQIAVEYGMGTDPESVALNDFDGDGDNDIVTSNFESDDVSVLLGNGDGTFLVAVNYLVGEGPRDVAVGDVNGDGDSDIVTANRIGNNVSVLLGNGDGTFQAAEHQSTGEKPRSVALGDSYGNGVVDIITASLDEDTISVLRRNGDGTFEVAVSYNVGDGPRSVTVGDMDGDGDSDIVTANKFSNSVSVLKGNGDGTFEAAVSYDVGSSPFSVDLGDVDGDGSIDIVTANRSSDDVSILIGNGDATFQDAVSHRMGDTPLSVVLGDVTNNGLNDIVTANAGTSNVSVFIATGDGAFRQSPAEFGLYAKINGAIQKVVDRNSDFGSRRLIDLAISHQALSGNQFVFHATFSDGTESLYHAELPADSFVEVTVQPGRGVGNVDFGASALPGTIQGVSFTDANVNGVFDPGESRNTGRMVFLDENLNGLLDDSERKTLVDEMGEFAFVDLPAEATYVVREVLPGSLAATTLRTLTEATLFLGAARTTSVDLGSVDQSALGESADGVVQGLVFTDANANRVQDDTTTEPGRANVTVFADENGDAVLNGGERSTVTASDGTFTLDQLTGIRQSITVVLPPATEQTVPLGNLFTTSTLRTVDSPVQVVSGDFDGDGIDDIASTINQASEVRFFLNDGTGHFNFGDRVEVASGPGSIDVGKFFGPDGREGLVVGHRTASSVKVLVPQQDGSFGTLDLITPQDVQAGGAFEGLGHAPYFVTTGDFNGDQQDDIAVAAQNAAPDGGAVSVFLSNGDGTFTHEQTVPLPKDKADAPTAITAGRANPGTTIDLVVANLVSANVVILSNSGVAGSDRFEIEDQSLPVGGISPTSVQLGDLDNDGHNEIVTTNLLSNDVSIFANNGDGTFETATQHSAGTGPAFAQLVDLDQNGSLDIAFSNSEASNRFGILRNRDDGTFLAAETSGLSDFPDGTLAFSLVIGQFDDNNNDGVIDDLDTPDVIVSNRSDESLTGAVGSLTVGLNQIVPGALRVDLPPGARSASGLNFGLRTLNLPPTVAEVNDPMAIDEDDPEQTLTVEEITTGGETESLQVTVSSDNTSLIDPTIVFDESSGTATLRYTPTQNLSGTAQLGVTVRDPGPNGTFDVDATDSDDGLTTRQFTVTVNAVDDPPPAVDDLFNVVYGIGATDLDVLGNDEAENPDTDEVLSVLFVHPAANGTVDIFDGRTLRYTPDADFVGTETLTYTVTDTRGTAQAEVTINVFAVTSVEFEVGNDDVEIDVVENLLRVRRNGVVDDTLGSVFAGSVDSITLTAGEGDNLIDLSGVTSGEFTLGTGITISINAGAGDDTIIGSGLPDMIEGGEGDDKINTGGGDDVATGGAGNDTLSGGAGMDALTGGEGNDRLQGQGSSYDTLSGGPGDDTLDGGDGYDRISESADVDFTATDSSLTGLGSDTLINIQLVQLFGGSTANTIDASAFSGRAFLNGSGGNDTLSGGGWYDRIFGGSGRDLITGGTSVIDPGPGTYTYDVLRGQGGNYDTLIGGDGNDKLNGGIGHDSLVGGGGDDVLTGESGNDTIDGGEGIDRLYERGNVDLTLTDTGLTGGLGNDAVSSIETAYLKGGNGDNLLDASAFSGDVTLIGVGGADTLRGGSGNDMLNGRSGADSITGGDGDDTLKGMRDADTINGGAGDDSLDGGTQDDRLSGWTGDDELYGRSGNDTLVGGEGNDSLYGAADNDLLQGDDGKTDTSHERDDDRLDGGDGTDTVRGGDGTDTKLDDASEIDESFAYWDAWVDAV